MRPEAMRPVRLPERWRIFAAALGVQIAVSTVAAALAVLVPFVKSDFRLSFAQAGLVVNLSALGSFASALPAGSMVDRLGDKQVLVMGALVTGVAALVGALSSSLLLLLCVVVVMGFGIATSTPAGGAAVRSAFSVGVRGTVMSLRQTGIPIGGFLAALLLPLLAVRYGWRVALLAAGLAAIIVALLALLLFPKRSPLPRYASRLGLPGFREVFVRDVAVIGGAGALLAAGQFCLITYLISYLIREQHMPLALAAAILASAQLAGAVARVFWGAVSDRLLNGRRAAALVMVSTTAAIGSLSLGLMPRNVPGWIVVPAVLLLAVGAVGWNGVQVSLLSELAPAGAEGRTIALGLMLVQPGIVGGPLLFGLVIDATQSFQAAWIGLAGVLAIAALIMTQARDAQAELVAPAYRSL